MSQPTTTEDVSKTTTTANQEVVHDKVTAPIEDKPNPCDETKEEASEQPNVAETGGDATKLDKESPAKEEEHKSPLKEDKKQADAATTEEKPSEKQQQLSGEEVARKRPFSEITKERDEKEVKSDAADPSEKRPKIVAAEATDAKPEQADKSSEVVEEKKDWLSVVLFFIFC